MAFGPVARLNGWSAEPVELAGRLIGSRPGYWHFHDGIRARWLRREYCRWKRIDRDGYGVMTMPSWLARNGGRLPKAGRAIHQKLSIETKL